MTSIIRFCPVSGGAYSETPHCYLLEVDQFTFLLDCGWDSNFCMDMMQAIKANIHKIDAVLLSYPDHLHIGALPFVVGKLGLSCPIYATVPVHKMGQMFLYDIYQARHNMEDFDLFTLDEVDRTFEMITQLKFNQTVLLKGKGEGISITPIPAGHMIGGCMWKIVKDNEEDIVYAVDYNHKRERHLNGCEVEKIARPSLLITDAFNANHNPDRRRIRDEKLMTNILQTLRSGGNVLVCVDTAGRVLELSHMVDQLWQNKESGLLAYSLALCNNVGYNVVEFAKSQIEWMSDKLMRTFEGRRSNPFQFKHLKLCHSMNEVNKVPSPKVVLASMLDLECGFSRDLFIQWSTNPKNSIILTCRCAPGTLGHDLITNGSNRTIVLDVRKRVKLTGAELDEFRRQKELDKSSKKVSDEDEESSDEELESGSKAMKHDIIMKSSHPADGNDDVSSAEKSTKSVKQGFFKSTKTKFAMFPCYEEKIRWDVYGEIIKPEDWMDWAQSSAPVKEKEVSTGHVAKMQSIGDDGTDISEIPTKCISTTQSLVLKAQIQYLDFEGLSDGESVLKLMQQLKPRRVILVRGSAEKVAAMAEICRLVVSKERPDSVRAVDQLFTPSTGQAVDATTESYIYQLRLPESLLSQVSFQCGKDNSYLAWVDGVVKKPQAEMMEADANSKKTDLIPMLEPLPLSLIQPHSYSFVNERKLSDFKMVLSSRNIPSEFHGGVLHCGSGAGGGLVALRRLDSGNVVIEGTVCDEYYQVRDLLYEQYAIV